MIKIAMFLVACLWASLCHAGQVLKRAEDFVANGLTYEFSIARFGGKLYANLELANHQDVTMVKYYNSAYKVALGVDGNIQMKGENELRTFGWGPLRRIEHDLKPGQRTGTGVPICVSDTNGQACSNMDFVVSAKRKHSFEFYIIKEDELYLIRRIEIKFSKEDIVTLAHPYPPR